MSFDLAARDTAKAAEAGIPVALMDPVNLSEPLTDDQGNQPTIVIMGGDAPKVRAKTHETLDEYYGRLRKGKPEGRSKSDEDDLIKRLAAATVSWVHIALDGVDLPCTYENAVKLYTRFRWIAEQLQSVIDNRAAFFTKGSAS